MRVICAWCEKEGSQTLLGEMKLYDQQMISHGICGDHEKVLLKQIQQLRNRGNPSLQRRRHSRVKRIVSTRLPTSPTTCMPVLTRRRLLKDRLPSAQLQLPFGDF